MSSKFKSKATLSSSSDSDSDADVKPVKKKQKKEKKPEKKSRSDDGDDEHMYALSATRFVNVREFKGRVLVDIREYYNNADGELKPGKKGISLTADQWKKLVDKVDEVNESISTIA